MLLWCFVLFSLGLLSIADSIFNYGIVFKTANSALYLLVALGILVRVRTMTRRKHKEHLERNNDRLRERMMEIRNTLDALKVGEPADEIKT